MVLLVGAPRLVSAVGDLINMGANMIGIGYEGLDLDALISRLRIRGVATIVDVRLSPISRKRGLSKTALRERLINEGIGYEHLPALGNPRDNREGFGELQGDDARQARERFRDILESTAAQIAMDRVHELAQSGTVALLCFEQDETRCHRELVLSALRTRLISI